MSTGNDLFDFNDRYGVKPARDWVKYAVFLAVIGGSWLMWAGLHHSRPALASELISFETTDPRNPTLRYSIDRRDGSNEVICTLVARDIDKNVVGQLDDRIPAGDNFLQRTIAIPTRADAVNVGIAICRLLNP